MLSDWSPGRLPALGRTLLLALGVHLALALGATALPEPGDLTIFKYWALRASAEGIHTAYTWESPGFDWLPLYLYLSKGVGLVFRVSGLMDWVGPYSQVLALLLKIPMILLNLLVGWFVYRCVDRFYGPKGNPLSAARAFVFNPAIALATDVFGYQDALHTALIFLAAYCVCTQRMIPASVWSALAFLTKPQAAIFLLPIAAVVVLRKGFRGLGLSVCIGTATAVAALLPFLVSGQMEGVIGMFLGVSRVHQWLSGCAHNIWWVFRPAPPFHSDRVALLWGLNGLEIGLGLLALFSVAVVWRLGRRPSSAKFVHLCSFLGFGFFMLPTEMHENYLYAVFPFLSVLLGAGRPLRWLYVGLTLTFALGLGLTIWWLQTGHIVTVVGLRVSVLNAVANVGMLVYWSYLVFVRDLSVDEVPGDASGASRI